LTDQQKTNKSGPSIKNNAPRTRTKGTTGSLNTGDWAWKDVAPKSGEALYKMVSGKEYVHCPNHATTKWVLASKHKDGCTLDADWKFPIKTSKVKVDDTKPNPTKKQLQYVKAMLSIASKNRFGSDDDDEDDENV
jgi:hypothetical protein